MKRIILLIILLLSANLIIYSQLPNNSFEIKLGELLGNYLSKVMAARRESSIWEKDEFETSDEYKRRKAQDCDFFIRQYEYVLKSVSGIELITYNADKQEYRVVFPLKKPINQLTNWAVNIKLYAIADYFKSTQNIYLLNDYNRLDYIYKISPTNAKTLKQIGDKNLIADVRIKFSRNWIDIIEDYDLNKYRSEILPIYFEYGVFNIRSK